MKANNDSKPIVFLFFAVMAFTAFTGYGLIQDPLHGVDTRSSVVNHRGPASVSAFVASDEQEPMTFDCASPSGSPIFVEAQQIQIRGQNCKASAKDVTNISTGYTASMFFPQRNSFLTDFIQLKKGRNQIKIADASGEIIEFTIERKSGRTL